MEKSKVFVTEFIGWDETVSRLLDSAKFAELVQGRESVVIKPNLVEPAEPPITTPVGLVRSIIRYLKKNCPAKKIVVAEGAGSIKHETDEIFEVLGYNAMAKEEKVELIDLNSAKTVRLTRKDCSRWPEMHLPSIIMDNFLLSVPVLKAHSLADVTLTMKNMLGAAPPSHYNAGSWKKSAFHSRIQEAIYELNLYRTPDFTVLDATEGMSEAHLWGPKCNPPPNKIAVSSDPVAIDAYGTQVLGRDWRKIGHIKMADGILGNAETADIVQL